MTSPPAPPPSPPLSNLLAIDTIYHEHFQYYTVLSAMRALAAGGLVGGTLVLGLQDWGHNTAGETRSMELLANEVAPRLDAVLASR